jgi:hypothetical protein
MFGALLNPLFAFLKCLLLWALGFLGSLLVDLLNLLVVAVAAALSVILALLPTVDLTSVGLPSSVVSAFDQVDYFLPLGLITTMVGIFLTVELAVWLFHLAAARLGFR